MVSGSYATPRPRPPIGEASMIASTCFFAAAEPSDRVGLPAAHVYPGKGEPSPRWRGRSRSGPSATSRPRARPALTPLVNAVEWVGRARGIAAGLQRFLTVGRHTPRSGPSYTNIRQALQTGTPSPRSVWQGRSVSRVSHASHGHRCTRRSSSFTGSGDSGTEPEPCGTTAPRTNLFNQHFERMALVDRATGLRVNRSSWANGTRAPRSSARMDAKVPVSLRLRRSADSRTFVRTVTFGNGGSSGAELGTFAPNASGYVVRVTVNGVPVRTIRSRRSGALQSCQVVNAVSIRS